MRLESETVAVLVLAGGAGSRLGGICKPALDYRGTALLRRVISAARAGIADSGTELPQLERHPEAQGSAPVVVVGDQQSLSELVAGSADIRWAREDPPGSGPVAAVAAGLEEVTSPWTLLLAADLPDPGPALRQLLAAWDASTDLSDGRILISAEAEQPLFGMYRTEALRHAMNQALAESESLGSESGSRHGQRSGPSLRRAIAKLKLVRVLVSEQCIPDIDEPDDARFWGIEIPEVAVAETKEEILARWCAELLAHYEIPETQIDIDEILSLAGKAAHTIVRPAAPLTTFIAGYAAGLAAGSGQAAEPVALESAFAVARQAVRQYPDGAQHSGGSGTDAQPDA